MIRVITALFYISSGFAFPDYKSDLTDWNINSLPVYNEKCNSFDCNEMDTNLTLLVINNRYTKFPVRLNHSGIHGKQLQP